MRFVMQYVAERLHCQEMTWGEKYLYVFCYRLEMQLEN